MSWSPVKGFSLFLFLVQKSVIPAPKLSKTSHRFMAAILYKTQNNSHTSPKPFIGPDSTPNSSASIKFFLYSSFSMFLNADPNHTIFLKMIPLKSPPTQLLCLFKCFLSTILTTTLKISPQQSRPPTRSLPSTLCELLSSYFLCRFCRLFIQSLDNSVCVFNTK